MSKADSGENNPELEFLLRTLFQQAVYSSENAARLLNVSDRQLQKFVNRGQLRKFGLGTRRDAFLATDLAAFILERMRLSAARPPARRGVAARSAAPDAGPRRNL